MSKCPGCEVDIENERKQVWHMERCHPEIIVQRWEGVLNRDEIATLSQEMDSRLPHFEELIEACRKEGWVVSFQSMKEGKWGNYVTLAYLESPFMSRHEVVETTGQSPIAALCLAMDIANYRIEVKNADRPKGDG